MRVTKWDNSLAVRIPVEVAEALHIKEGDEVNLTVVQGNAGATNSKNDREKALEHIRSQRWQLPPDWKFDRDEANER